MVQTDIVFGLDYNCCKGHLLATRVLNSCTPELKPDRQVPVFSFCPCLPPFTTLFPLSHFPLPSFVSCCLKVILKAFWSLSKEKRENIKCLRLCFLSQLGFQSPLQPDLYMTVPEHPLAISAEEVGWPLHLVQGDRVCCRVNDFPFQCGVHSNCCLLLLDYPGISPRVG